MKTRRTGVIVVTLTLSLLLLFGLARAQDPEANPKPTGVAAVPGGSVPDDSSSGPVGAASVSAALSDIIPFQGRLTATDGVPLNGSYSIKLALYDVSSGGVALCEDTDTVNVSNGLFVFNMNFCSAADTDGSKQLYLGVKVGTDPEMTPRQAIYPVPYARSVRPGAIINQTSTSAHGLTVQSAGSGSAGTSLSVNNSNTTAVGGIGVWSTVAGGDAAIIASNNGSGPLFKGFGAGGGEDEFTVRNNGAIETKADSYIFVPGSALVKNVNTDTTRWDIQPNGGARIWRGAVAGGKYVYYPIVVPTTLYGQPVKVKGITIYYRTLDGTKGYISATNLHKHTGAEDYISVIADGTDRSATTATSYTLTPTADNVLASGQGLALQVYLSFADDSNWVQIGGIRVQLGHHDLY